MKRAYDAVRAVVRSVRLTFWDGFVACSCVHFALSSGNPTELPFLFASTVMLTAMVYWTVSPHIRAACRASGGHEANGA